MRRAPVHCNCTIAVVTDVTGGDSRVCACVCARRGAACAATAVHYGVRVSTCPRGSNAGRTTFSPARTPTLAHAHVCARTCCCSVRVPNSSQVRTQTTHVHGTRHWRRSSLRACAQTYPRPARRLCSRPGCWECTWHDTSTRHGEQRQSGTSKALVFIVSSSLHSHPTIRAAAAHTRTRARTRARGPCTRLLSCAQKRRRAAGPCPRARVVRTGVAQGRRDGIVKRACSLLVHVTSGECAEVRERAPAAAGEQSAAANAGVPALHPHPPAHSCHHHVSGCSTVDVAHSHARTVCRRPACTQASGSTRGGGSRKRSRGRAPHAPLLGRAATSRTNERAHGPARARKCQTLSRRRAPTQHALDHDHAHARPNHQTRRSRAHSTVAQAPWATAPLRRHALVASWQTRVCRRDWVGVGACAAAAAQRRTLACACIDAHAHAHTLHHGGTRSSLPGRAHCTQTTGASTWARGPGKAGVRAPRTAPCRAHHAAWRARP